MSSCPHCPSPGAVSPSQIKLFTLCHRKWAFRHVAGIKEPERAYQILGTEIHKANENYLTLGIRPKATTKAGEIALASIDLLPPPHPGHLCEKHIHLQNGGLLFHGYPDLIPHDEDIVYDFKSTGDLRYALKPHDLLTDEQALIYAMWLYQRTQARTIGLRWIYYHTRSPYRHRTVDATLTVGQLAINFARYVLQPAEQMLESRIDPNELEPNLDSCNAYGGCFYRAQCKKQETFGMLFKDKLRAAQSPIAEKMAETALQEEIESEQAITGQADLLDEPTIKSIRQLDHASLKEAIDELDNTPTPEFAKIVPPDAPAPVRTLPTMPAREAKPPLDAPQGPSRSRGRPRKAPTTTGIVAVASGPSFVPSKPKAEPVIAANKPDLVEAVIQGIADPAGRSGLDAIVPAESTPDPQMPVEPSVPQADGYSLCVNALPLRAPVILLADILAPIIKKLAETLGVPHYRLSKEAEYGRGDAVLLSAYKEVAPQLTGYVFADKRDPDVMAILPYLESSATQVFRGVF